MLKLEKKREVKKNDFLFGQNLKKERVKKRGFLS